MAATTTATLKCRSVEAVDDECLNGESFGELLERIVDIRGVETDELKEDN